MVKFTLAIKISEDPTVTQPQADLHLIVPDISMVRNSLEVEAAGYTLTVGGLTPIVEAIKEHKDARTH